MDPPRTLSFTWGWEPHKPGWPETQVTLDFLPRESGTELVLTHERFRSEPDKNSHAQGWEGVSIAFVASFQKLLIGLLSPFTSS